MSDIANPRTNAAWQNSVHGRLLQNPQRPESHRPRAKITGSGWKVRQKNKVSSRDGRRAPHRAETSQSLESIVPSRKTPNVKGLTGRSLGVEGRTDAAEALSVAPGSAMSDAANPRRNAAWQDSAHRRLLHNRETLRKRRLPSPITGSGWKVRQKNKVSSRAGRRASHRAETSQGLLAIVPSQKCRTLKVSHDHGWRGACAARSVTDMIVVL